MDYNNLGMAWRNLGEYKKAIDYCTKALEIDRAIHGEQHPDVARDYNNLGVLCTDLKEYKKAIDYFTKALEIDRKVYEEKQHPDVARDYNNLGGAWRQLGEYKKAIDYFTKALAICKIAYGPSHPNTQTVISNRNEAIEHSQSSTSPDEPLAPRH
jgi:tetratricopeptide (TPR) repeat protein